jgi:translocation and assembly module TamB
MGRRRLVVFVSALIMLLLGGGIVGGLMAATQSDGGRDFLRRQLSRQLGRGIKGTLHIGRLSGSIITDLTIDSVLLKGLDDSVFVATGPIRLTYDARDILDGRIIIRSAELQHPFAVIRKEIDEQWNFRKIFPVEAEGPPGAPPARRAFGALVVLHNVHIKGGHFQLTLPWEPDDSLSGARRDSAIVENLAVKEHEIRRVTVKGKRGFQRTWRWTDWNIALTRARFRQPDTTGRQFDIARMDVTERVPPFQFRNMNGSARWLGDTIQIEFKHFELPNSVARAKGTVKWGNDEPIRYDIKIHSDSTGLADLAWITSGLPKTGHGSMDLHIKNERDLRVLDYAITNMDMHTGPSRLKGAMTYGVGAPVLIVKDVNLELLPVDFALLETFNGGKFPLPWRGAITGNVRARGGPVNHFLVDDAKLVFSDRNVPGAITRGGGSGEVDILAPSRATFHGFKINVAQFDLRTAQFLNADFPRLNGLVSGTGIIDSIWTDLRFRDAEIVHRDGDAEAPSKFKGGGRLTLGEKNISFDVSAAALPLSMSSVAESYPSLPLRGVFNGSLRVKGTADDLSLITDLTGDAGRLQLDAQVDLLPPGYRAIARGELSHFDFRRAMAKPALPPSSFNGRFAVDLAGDSLANLFGTVELFADRSLVDSIRIYSGRTTLGFANGTIRVDSLRVESTAGLLTANGALAIAPGPSDTLRFAVVIDSLGGLRRYLASVRPARFADSATANTIVFADSLDGNLRASGTLAGITERLSLRATIDGSGLRVGETSARALTSSLQLDALPDSATGVVSFRLDTLRAAGIAFSRVDGRANLLGGSRAVATANAETPQGVTARANADIRRHHDTTDIRLDSLAVRTSGNAWSLTRTASLRITPDAFGVDTLSLAGARGGRLTVTGRVPVDSAIALAIVADALPLADFGEFAQTSPISGIIAARIDLRGTRAAPDFTFSTSLADARFAGLQLESVNADGRYANRRLTTTLDYRQAGLSALHASAALPIDLGNGAQGSRFLEEPLTARIRTDSGGLRLLESFSGEVKNASGSMALNLDVSGSWKHPRLAGALRIADGALSLVPLGDVKLSGVEADIAFLGDSIAVRRIAARSSSQHTSNAVLSGYIGIREFENPRFDLQFKAEGFNAVNRARVADLDITGDLRVTGALDAATLSGALAVDRGTIVVPELYQKRVISLDDPELYRVVDTTAFLDRRLLPGAPGVFMDNLVIRSVPIRMGGDVWLRSEEANINLGGSVNVTRGRVQRGANAGALQLALDGSLQTVRGTYRLNLGPVQRAFEVEQGEMRFYGDPDLNATLNINALHTVRQFSQQAARPDVRVRVHIGGTLLAPTAELSSPDSLRVTNADLISYLVTGSPSYEIGGRNGDYTSAAARVLLSSSFSVLGAKATGVICDDAQFSSAGLDVYAGRIRDVGTNILSGTRFNCAKQVSEKAFVRLDYGLCQVGQLLGGGSSSDPLTFADALGFKLDYRISKSVTASLGMDPATSALLCTRDSNARGFAPTPRQFGIDLFRLWRF